MEFTHETMLMFFKGEFHGNIRDLLMGFSWGLHGFLLDFNGFDVVLIFFLIMSSSGNR